MTMLPLVHIGMAKAASTFLQLEVFPNVKGLLNLGKHHVFDDLRNAGNALTRRTSADWNLAMFREPFDAALAKASAEGLRPVLSNEDFSVYKFLDPEMMALRLRQILGPYDVLLIIREPVSWLRSHYLSPILVGIVGLPSKGGTILEFAPLHALHALRPDHHGSLDGSEATNR